MNFPNFNGVLGLIGFLILAFLLFENKSGASKIFDSLAKNASSLIKTLQGN